MAKDVVDRLGEFFGKKEKCRTDKVPLHGWSVLSRRHWENWTAIAVEDMTIRYDLPQDVAHHLLRYGENYKQVCKYLKEHHPLMERISAERPYILAEVDYVVNHEHALTLNDFMFRRTQLQLSNHQGLDCVEQVARRMAYLLAWSAEREKQEITTYQQSLVWNP
jgi:glycerol-3-phosphate dehydrogenase